MDKKIDRETILPYSRKAASKKEYEFQSALA